MVLIWHFEEYPLHTNTPNALPYYCFLFCFDPGSPVAQVPFEHLIFLPPRPGCWGYRNMVSYVVQRKSFLDQGNIRK